MADFSSLEKAIADLGVEVGEIIELLNTDSADQASVAADALTSFGRRWRSLSRMR